MRRRTAIPLLIGWLLGIGTALAVPDLRYQRQTILTAEPAAGGRPRGAERLRQATNDGWTIVRQDGDSVTIERPRLRLP